MSSNLLQETVLRAAHQLDQTRVLGSRNDLPLSPSKSHRFASTNPSANNSDEEDMTITRVHTPTFLNSPPSEMGTPIHSRPTSPSRAPHPLSSPNSSNKSRANSRVGARAKREAAAKAKASSSDPLCRFPNHLSVRIFELVGLGSDGTGGSEGDIFSGVRDLMACGLVCQKWRASATINFVWFKLCRLVSYATSLEKAFEPPTWTRKDAQVNWSSRYRIKNQAPDHSRTVIQDSDLVVTLTANELKHLQWQQEEEDNGGGKFTNKMEARAFYKELGGRKLKNKTGKSLGTDRTGWEDFDVQE